MLANRFQPAYVFFSAAGLWALIYWQVSDYLTHKLRNLRTQEQRLNHNPKQHRAVVAFKKARRSYWLPNVLVSTVVAFSTVGCLIWTRSIETEYELSLSSGLLEPAKDADPDICAHLPILPSTFRLYVGSSRLHTDFFPYEPLVADKTPLFTIIKDEKGQIGINVDVLSSDRRTIIARIVGNRFVTNRNKYLEMQRPDKSTLIVIDQEGTKVIDIRYSNPHAIRLRGALYVSNRKNRVVIDDEAIQGDGGTTSHVCQSYMRGISPTIYVH